MLVLPRRLQEPVAFEPPKRGIDGAARQLSLVDDVETILKAVGNRLQHADGGNTQSFHPGTFSTLGTLGTLVVMLHRVRRHVASKGWVG